MDYSKFSREQLEAALLGEDVQTPSLFGCKEAGTPDSHTGGRARRSIIRRRLAVARELLLRFAHQSLIWDAPLSSPAISRSYLQLHFAHLAHEVFVVVFLDAQNRVLACDEMFRGTLTHTSVYPREIVLAALWYGAGACVFAHNHPSGSAEPSRADELLTRALKDALAIVDVRVLDHMIVAGDRITSFAERGLL